MSKFDVVQVDGLDEISALLEESVAEGHRHIQRLVEEYENGINRFSQSGEMLLAAVCEGTIIGICGLNRNPYGERGDIGRIRRMYVMKPYRRQGIATKLLEALIDEAGKHYHTLVLFTDNPSADQMYRSLGFISASKLEKCSHQLELNRYGGYPSGGRLNDYEFH